MLEAKKMSQMVEKNGFIAALDQSGGSTPGALRLYGIADSDFLRAKCQIFVACLHFF